MVKYYLDFYRRFCPMHHAKILNALILIYRQKPMVNKMTQKNEIYYLSKPCAVSNKMKLITEPAIFAISTLNALIENAHCRSFGP